MKKAIVILVLGLLWCNVGFAGEVVVYHKDENSISLKFRYFSTLPNKRMAAKHCAQYRKFAFDFHGEMSDGVNEGKVYRCSSKNLSKSPISGGRVRWTNYDENHEFAQEQKDDKKFAKLESYKRTCESLGFKPGTDKFADCALKLFIADNKEAQVVQSSSGVQEVIIRDPDREQRIRLRKFNDRVSGKCAWTDWNC